MQFLIIYVFLRLISASVVVKIYRSAIYHPVSSCAFLRNILLLSDASIQSCIWECVHVDNCQAAVYYNNEKNCSLFAESCTSENIHPSNNIQASVICYPRGNDNIVTCPSTMAPNQVEETTVVNDPMCTPFWIMPPSDEGTYLTYRNANTLISGDHSRSMCGSFRSNTSNVNQLLFSIGSNESTWHNNEGCNTHFALDILNASQVNIYGMRPGYDNTNIDLGQNILQDGQFHHICATYNNNTHQLCIYLDASLSTCLTRTNPPYNTGLGDVRIGWWPDNNRQFDASGGGLIRSVSLFNVAINQSCAIRLQ